MTRRLLLACLLIAAPALAADIDEASGLIKADGWEQVRIHCGGCHSHKLVTSQRADRTTWLAMIRWMQATQNLWQFPPATEQQILEYLASNYPPQENMRRAPLPAALLPPPEPSDGS